MEGGQARGRGGQKRVTGKRQRRGGRGGAEMESRWVQRVEGGGGRGGQVRGLGSRAEEECRWGYDGVRVGMGEGGR